MGKRQTTEDGRRMTDGKRWEDRKLGRGEDGKRQKTEDGRRKTDGRRWKLGRGEDKITNYKIQYPCL